MVAQSVYVLLRVVVRVRKPDSLESGFQHCSVLSRDAVEVRRSARHLTADKQDPLINVTGVVRDASGLFASLTKIPRKPTFV